LTSAFVVAAAEVVMLGEHETDAVKVPPKPPPKVSIETHHPSVTEFEIKMTPSAFVLKPPLTATIPLGHSATTESMAPVEMAFVASTRTRR